VDEQTGGSILVIDENARKAIGLTRRLYTRNLGKQTIERAETAIIELQSNQRKMNILF
jgi:hypothetical protein